VQMRAILLYVHNYYVWCIDLNCILDVQYIIVSDLILVFQYWCPWGAEWSVDYEGVSLGSRVVSRLKKNTVLFTQQQQQKQRVNMSVRAQKKYLNFF